MPRLRTMSDSQQVMDGPVSLSFRPLTIRAAGAMIVGGAVAVLPRVQTWH